MPSAALVVPIGLHLSRLDACNLCVIDSGSSDHQAAEQQPLRTSCRVVALPLLQLTGNTATSCPQEDPEVLRRLNDALLAHQETVERESATAEEGLPDAAFASPALWNMIAPHRAADEDFRETPLQVICLPVTLSERCLELHLDVQITAAATLALSPSCLTPESRRRVSQLAANDCLSLECDGDVADEVMRRWVAPLFLGRSVVCAAGEAIPLRKGMSEAPGIGAVTIVATNPCDSAVVVDELSSVRLVTLTVFVQTSVTQVPSPIRSSPLPQLRHGRVADKGINKEASSLMDPRAQHVAWKSDGLEPTGAGGAERDPDMNRSACFQLLRQWGDIEAEWPVAVARRMLRLGDAASVAPSQPSTSPSRRRITRDPTAGTASSNAVVAAASPWVLDDFLGDVERRALRVATAQHDIVRYLTGNASSSHLAHTMRDCVMLLTKVPDHVPLHVIGFACEKRGVRVHSTWRAQATGHVYITYTKQSRAAALSLMSQSARDSSAFLIDGCVPDVVDLHHSIVDDLCRVLDFERLEVDRTLGIVQTDVNFERILGSYYDRVHELEHRAVVLQQRSGEEARRPQPASRGSFAEPSSVTSSILAVSGGDSLDATWAHSPSPRPPREALASIATELMTARSRSDSAMQKLVSSLEASRRATQPWLRFSSMHDHLSAAWGRHSDEWLEWTGGTEKGTVVGRADLRALVMEVQRAVDAEAGFNVFGSTQAAAIMQSVIERTKQLKDALQRVGAHYEVLFSFYRNDVLPAVTCRPPLLETYLACTRRASECTGRPSMAVAELSATLRGGDLVTEGQHGGSLSLATSLEEAERDSFFRLLTHAGVELRMAPLPGSK